MFSKFDTLSNLPKPFGLFTSQKEKNTENTEENDSSEAVDTPLREGLTTKELIKDPKKTDDIQSGQSKLAGFLTAVFLILFVIVGLIYYFNSNLLMMKQLMIQPFYTKEQFWQRFKGNMVASKVTVFGILWMVVFCLNLLLMDMVFQNNEYDNIFYVTTIFYWSIVGSTMLLIGNIPSLVDVFENTIGYSILGMFYNLKQIMTMFKNRTFKSDTLKMSYDFLITTFSIPSFHDYFDELCKQYPTNEEYNNPISITDRPKSDFYIDLNTWMVTDEEQLKTLSAPPGRPDTNKEINSRESLYAREELLKCVVTKNTIGHFVWVYLASAVTLLCAINTLVQ